MLINLLGITQFNSLLFPFLFNLFYYVFIFCCFLYLRQIFQSSRNLPRVMLQQTCGLIGFCFPHFSPPPLFPLLPSLALTCWCCCCGCCCGCSKAYGANSCPYSLLLLLLLALFRLLANTSNAPRPPTSEPASEMGAAEPGLWCRKLRELRPKTARCQTELELDVAEARPSNRASAAHNGMLLIFGQLVAAPQHGHRLHTPGASCKWRQQTKHGV